MCDQISIVRWHTRAEARVEIGKDKKFFFFQKLFCLLHSRIWHGLFANICRKHGSIRYLFFINLWWFSIFSIFFTFRFIRRNVCYHLQRTFLMWFDKIPLVGVQSGSLYFSGNNTIWYDFGEKNISKLTNCVEAIEISFILPHPIINVSLICGGSHVWTFSDSCDPENMQWPSIPNRMVL